MRSRSSEKQVRARCCSMGNIAALNAKEAPLRGGLRPWGRGALLLIPRRHFRQEVLPRDVSLSRLMPPLPAKRQPLKKQAGAILIRRWAFREKKFDERQKKNDTPLLQD